MKAVLVSVDYGDILRLTLPRNVRYFEQIAIATVARDLETRRLAAGFPNVTVHVTDAFYAAGASFNKGLVLEQLFDVVGRDGWLCVLDADIVLPEAFASHAFRDGLTTPRRRMLDNPRKFSDKLNWEQVPAISEKGWWGYCQVFRADDPALASRPWYPAHWSHAGGCDEEFQSKWPQERKHRTDFDVLHLGPRSKNWCGRITDRVDRKAIPNVAKNLKAMARLRAEHQARKRRPQ